jgi:hypothetical protein
MRYPETVSILQVPVLPRFSSAPSTSLKNPMLVSELPRPGLSWSRSHSAFHFLLLSLSPLHQALPTTYSNQFGPRASYSILLLLTSLLRFPARKRRNREPCPNLAPAPRHTAAPDPSQSNARLQGVVHCFANRSRRGRDIFIHCTWNLAFKPAGLNQISTIASTQANCTSSFLLLPLDPQTLPLSWSFLLVQGLVRHGDCDGFEFSTLERDARTLRQSWPASRVKRRES